MLPHRHLGLLFGETPHRLFRQGVIISLRTRVAKIVGLHQERNFQQYCWWNVFSVHFFNSIIGTAKVSAVNRVKGDGNICVLGHKAFDYIQACVHGQVVHDIKVHSATSEYDPPDFARLTADPSGD